jgi:hypothetical protein
VISRRVQTLYDSSTVFGPKALEEALVGDSPVDRTYHYFPVQCSRDLLLKM